MGYVLRLTEANGYPSTSYVIHAMTDKWYASCRGRLDAVPLIELAGLSEAEADRLSLKSRTESRSIFNVAGCELMSNDFSIGRPRVCPKCLEQNGFCDAFWDISYAQVCPIHGTWMVDVCPKCQKSLSWSRAKVAECRCGHPLAGIRTGQAPKPVVDLMRVLRAATFRDEVIATFPEGIDHLRGLDMRQLCKLIWVMSDILHMKEHGGRSARMTRSRGKLAGYLSVVAEALSDWPRGFQSFLDSQYSEVLASTEVLPSFRSEFNWALIRLSKNTPDGEHAFRFLIQEIYSFGAKYWPKPFLIGRNSKCGLVQLPEQMPWGTHADLAKELGVDARTLIRDLEAMDVPTRMTSSMRSGTHIIYDLDWARNQRPKSEYRPIGVRQAARVLGISNGTLHVLRSRGVIGSTHRTHRNGVFSKEDLTQFKERIGLAVAHSPKKKMKGLPTLDGLSRLLNLTPELKATLYEAVLDGRVHVRGNAAGSPEQFQINPDDVTPLLGDYLTSRDLFMSFAEAREMLQCDYSVTRGLAGAGYLQRRLFRGRYHLLRESVLQFNQRYELASSVCRRMNTWSSVVSTRARKLKIRVRTVRCTQRDALIFRRKDIPKLEALIRVEGNLL